MKKNSKKEIKKVLFYTDVSRLFRDTLIGHLYEIAQIYPTILLFEELDLETMEIIKDKNLFPNLIEIIRTDSPFHKKVIDKNRRMYKTIKNTILRHKPDIVISGNDMNPADLYLMRYAKKVGAVTMAMQSGLRVRELKNLALFSNLNSAHVKMPPFLPFSLRLFLARLKKLLGHFFYYWFLPITVGEMPFLGKSSFIQLKGTPGMRDGDYYIVFSKREYDICIKEGTPPEKLYILSHPLARNIMNKFLKINSTQSSPKKKTKDKKVLTLMYSTEETGFKGTDYQLIPKEELLQSRIKIVSLIAEILKDWKIFIKPHPSMAELPELLQKITQTFESISKQIKVVNPLEPADKYIEMSDVIVGIPPASNVIFIASLQCPEKIILSIDLKHEFLGDAYKDFEGVENIDSKKKFIEILKLIRNNKYKKEGKKETGKEEGFISAVELINYLFNKKHAGN
jgi:hypothetical protein